MKLILLFCLILSTSSNLWKTGYEIGDRVSDFKLRNVDDRWMSLSDYKEAKGFIIIFDCNTCPYSKAYNQRILDLHDTYTKRGFPVIAINANKGDGDSFKEMVRQAKAKDYMHPYLYDETQQVAKAFGATNTPQAFVLNQELRIAYIGAIDDNASDAALVTRHYVQEAVDALLNGKTVPIAKTKAIGCGIRWK